MAVIYDYFLAETDAEAAITVDWTGGPSKPPSRGRLLRRRVTEGRPTLALPGLEPIVMMGTLESLLTGRSSDDLISANADRVIATRGGGERLVVGLSGNLQRALAAADEAYLRQVAHPWSETDEIMSPGDADLLGDRLTELAGLARAGLASEQAIYCWVCV